MGINWRAAFQGALGATSNTTGMLITDQIAQKREARMAQYRQSEKIDDRAYQDQVRQDTFEHQGNITQAKIEADQQAAMQQREMQVADAELEHQRGQQDIRLRESIKTPDTVINNNMGGSIGHLRGKKAQEGLGSGDAARIDEIQRAAAGVAKIRDSLSILEQVGSEFKTGKVPDMLAAVGEYMGTDAGAARQMVSGAVAPMVLELMSQQKGPQTDADRVQFEKTMATFDKSPEAFQLLIGLANKYISRATENAQALNEYMQTDFYKENGHLGEFKAPNAITVVKDSGLTRKSMNAADDPLGLFK